MRFLRQSTSVNVTIGPFLDSGDGITPETALTITQPDILLSKIGGAWAQKAAAQTLTHQSNGWYQVQLDATDTNTLGILMLAVTETGAVPIWHEFMVVPSNIWDSWFATDLQDVSVTQWLGSAVTAAVAGKPDVDTTYWNGVAVSGSGGRPDVNPTHWLGSAIAPVTVAGVPEVDLTHVGGAAAGAALPANVTQWLGAAAAPVTVAGVPEVDITHALGVALGSTVLPANVTQISGSAPAADLLELFALALSAAGLIDSGTLDANAITAAAIAPGAIDAATFAAGAIDAAAIATGAIDADAIAADAIGASELATDAVTEIVNAVWAKTGTEPGSVPAHTATLVAKLDFLYAALRNKVTQTSTLYTLRNDADSGNLATAAVADDGTTLTRNELA